MCLGDFLTNLDTTNHEQLTQIQKHILGTVVESLKEEKKTQDEILLDDHADASRCCQQIIEFWENHLLVPYRNEPNYGKLIERAIVEATNNNCKSYIDGLRKSSSKASQSILLQFEKCQNGEEFDFIANYEEG